MSEASPSRIHVLPSALADQIAAGEVVERAASVVKELVENSLDAGAHTIDVEIVAGGRQLVRVVDDGGGMTAAEARLALQRHATSKIARADDLWGLRTFGFRGEALPSIAAVSRLRLATRTADADEGSSVDVEAGEPGETRAVGMPTGTRIEVRDLFFNTPARQKFQKTEVTEAGNVSEAILRLALAHPEVHFRLRSNDRMALDLPPHRDLAERVRAALARRGGGALHEAAGAEGPPGRENRVRAFLGAPEDASTTSRSTFLMVGRRFVRDRALLQALAMGYGERLERGRYPLAALFVDVPPDEVDVNVHPQKLEVRFAQPQQVYGAVRHVIAAAVAKAPWSARGAPTIAFAAPTAWSRPASIGPGGTPGQAAGSASRPPDLASRLRDADDPIPALATSDRPDDAPAGRFSRLRFLGQINRSYLVCEGEGGLVLVDPDAARERIVFARLRAGARTGPVPGRRLVFPIPVELPPPLAPATAVSTHGAMLARLGFEVEVFGDRTLLVRAVPDCLADVAPKPLLLDVLARLGSGIGATPAPFDDLLVAMARQAGTERDVLGFETVARLLADLDAVLPDAANAGLRPVVLRMPAEEIARRLGPS